MNKRWLPILGMLVFSVSLHGQGSVVVFDEQQRFDVVDRYEPDGDTVSLWLSVPLSAYDGPFASLSRYRFSFVRYARRGYAWNCSRRLLNGIDLDNPVTGEPFWNVLTAVRQAPVRLDEQPGIAPSVSTVGNAGNICEYDLDVLHEPPGGRAGWMFTDRRFRQGLRAGIATGTLGGGWAFAAAGTRRWGRDRHIRGVYADEWSLCLSLGRRLGAKNSLSAVFLMAPSERGLRSASTGEAFEASGDRLYNPAWGYQQGRVRPSRVRCERTPMALITWRCGADTRWNLTTTVSALWGTSSRSALDWYDARNPLPDYYRYLPGSYENPEVSGAVSAAWRQRDVRVTQIDWEELYLANGNRDTLPAAYVLGSAVDRFRNWQFVSCFDYHPSRTLRLRGGVRVRIDRTTAYNRLDDLLSAAFLFDIDPYLIDDRYFGDKLQNNLRAPDRRVAVGERYGYDYDLDYVCGEGWLTADLRNRSDERFGGYVALRVAQVGYSRNGRYEKELFPGSDSYGRSSRLHFTEYTLKGGIDCLFTPAHTLRLDLLYEDVAPAARDVFVSIDYRNRTVGDPRTANRFGGELSYRYAGRTVRLELCAYATVSRGESEVRRYYDDIASVYSDMELSGIGKLYAGVEFGAEVLLTRRFALRVAASQARNSYRNDPSVRILSDKDGSVIADRARSLLKGYRLGGSPQRIASAELSYRGAKLWMASLSVNYAADHYTTVSPLNRMGRVYDYAASPEDLRALTEQERFPEAFTIDLFVSKSFRLGSRYLSVSAAVNNLANRKEIVYSGYEQMRLRKSGTGLNQSITAFGSKYLYAYPRTYYLTVNFRF
ncbi:MULTISPECIES: hypothetical protein [Alistipes]|uniref:TonB-dependent receptor n=1 Tax=Alistipes hominis TaxID=2763015 RepID=A0ABR7CL02_9BACT|nr:MULTISPECIES: hypothetical protein [Alistipes]MBC5615915.1 hypothetical protein [Alistipes hominis]MBS1413558.1 hypothetical protein [Alistipes sp.]